VRDWSIDARVDLDDDRSNRNGDESVLDRGPDADDHHDDHDHCRLTGTRADASGHEFDRNRGSVVPRRVHRHDVHHNVQRADRHATIATPHGFSGHRRRAGGGRVYGHDAHRTCDRAVGRNVHHYRPRLIGSGDQRNRGRNVDDHPRLLGGDTSSSGHIRAWTSSSKHGLGNERYRPHGEPRGSRQGVRRRADAVQGHVDQLRGRALGYRLARHHGCPARCEERAGRASPDQGAILQPQRRRGACPGDRQLRRGLRAIERGTTVRHCSHRPTISGAFFGQ
jgi:hypothetical protein